MLRTFYLRTFLRIFPVYYLYLIGFWLAGSQEIRQQFWWHATFNSNLLFSFIPFTSLTPHFFTFLSRRAILSTLAHDYPPGAEETSAHDFIGVHCQRAALPAHCTICWLFTKRRRHDYDCLSRLLGRRGPAGIFVLCYRPKQNVLLKLGLWSLPIPLYLAAFGTFQSNYIDNLARMPCAFAFAWIIAPYTERNNAFLHPRALVAIGAVSYGAYIFHLAAGRVVCDVYSWAFAVHLRRGPLLFALVLTATLGIAALSWKLFEEPINSLKSHWPYVTKRSPNDLP